MSVNEAFNNKIKRYVGVMQHFIFSVVVTGSVIPLRRGKEKILQIVVSRPKENSAICLV
jgi:hypothetical protein